MLLLVKAWYFFFESNINFSICKYHDKLFMGKMTCLLYYKILYIPKEQKDESLSYFP